MKKLMFIAYTLFLLLLSVISYAFIDPNLIYYKILYTGFAFQNRSIVTIIYFALVLIFFGFYIVFMHLFHKKKWKEKELKLLLGITCCILLFSYPAMLSFDIFNYIATAKVLFFYHENPYIIMPIEFVGDPLLLFTHAANKLALYGPGWILLTGIPYVWGLGSFFFTILNFKLFVSIFYLIAVVTLWKLAKNIYVVALFACNPLVVIEILVSGHNDIVMMSLVLISLLFIQKKRYIVAVLLFFASIFIKYASVFLLPVFIVILWRAYRKQVINWDKMYFYSFLSMLLIFLLSPLREEMYPWYAIWFLPFVFLMVAKNPWARSVQRIIVYLSIALSFGLLLRYIPFMLLGTYFGMTPLLRIILAAVPVTIVGLIMLGRIVRR